MSNVTGTVKFTDGSIPQGEVATVTFTPAPGSMAEVKKGASGQIQPDGNFELMTNRPGDGVHYGTYKVFFTVLKSYRGGGSLIPPQYTDANQTPFEVEVNESSHTFPFELEK